MFDKSSLLCEALVSQYDTYGAVLCVYLQFVHITSDNFDTYIFVNEHVIYFVFSTSNY